MKDREAHPVPEPSVDDDGILRREVLQLIGATVALGACEPPRGKILPYTRQPREVVPGKPQVYATSLVERGVALGVLVQSHSGRPIKVDGNPDHPTTLGGGSTPALQASIYDLYDPARGRGVQGKRRPGLWSAFSREFREVPAGGRGAHILLEPTSSPLLISQLQQFQQRYPEARIHFFDPLRRRSEEQAHRLAFGRVLKPQLAFDEAWTVASFDADFLTHPPERIRYAYDFSKTRRIHEKGDRMGRLWMAEGDLTVTGAIADERLRAKPSEIPFLLVTLVAELSKLGGAAIPIPDGIRSLSGPAWIQRLARDLVANSGASLVLVGERHPPEAHLVALLANTMLGNLGSTLTFTDPILFEAGEGSHDLEPLAQALERGEVESLLIVGGNPALTAPSDLALSARIPMAKKAAYLGLYENETAALCDWYLPALHTLEAWGDARGHDGTVSLIQPLIRPLVSGRSAVEVLASLQGDPNPQGERLLRSQHAALGISAWQTALQWGFLAGPFPPVEAAPAQGSLLQGLGPASQRPPAVELEEAFRQDTKLEDGSKARNAWLVELPDPITRLSWQNAALLSPETARRLGVRGGQLVDLKRDGLTVRIPVHPVQGMADGLITLPLGWGQAAPAWSGGRPTSLEIAGTNVYPLRTRDEWVRHDIQLALASGSSLPLEGGRHLFSDIISQQPEIDSRGRPILLSAALSTWKKTPNFVHPHDKPAPNLYGSPWNYSGDQWAMSIDLTTCIGCAACVIACQAENNTPSVGPVNARKGRMMHWLRIDRYILGESDDEIQYLPQPMLCQHCETAPCEYVCPTNATVHSPDGLNEMVYNRCIGTRFCSNNCPYKVRRFNYFRYNHHLEPETLKMIHNPNVTVRERGVMEKCTYCVQRIRTAQIDARIAGSPIEDGAVKTACQVACPTEAIVFGLISDPESSVSRLRSSPRTYAVLNADLGTEPRTRYLAHLHNRWEES